MKKKHKFKNLENISIGINPKKYIEYHKTLLNQCTDIKLLPNISFFIVHDNSNNASIYSKENYELIQQIKNSNNCHILNEDSIIFSIIDQNSCTSHEVWVKDINRKIFIKKKVLDSSFIFNSNILSNSKSHLFFYHRDNQTPEIQVWDTQDSIPQNIILKINTIFSHDKQLMFLNNENILVVNHSSFYNNNKQNISFYLTKNFEIIKNLEDEDDAQKSAQKIYKLDENRLIIIEHFIYNEYNNKNRQYVQIMKVPEFEIVKEFETSFPGNKILVYKKYFILYSPSIIEIYNSDNYQLFKNVHIKCVYYLSYLKENYLIGLQRSDALLNKDVTVYKIDI